jgi:hypothetical protein
MIIRGLFFAIQRKHILPAYHLVVVHVQLNLLHIGRHEFGQLLVLGHFQMADEFIQQHLILDRFLRAGYAACVHGEFEGDLSDLGGYVEGAVVGDDLFVIISILFLEM